MAQPDHGVIVGVDTHGDGHVAAAFTSDLGRPLGHLDIATTPTGYRSLLAWAHGFGSDPRFGVEGTGSYGAGVARFLVAAGCTVIEVNRPNRQTRYARGRPMSRVTTIITGPDGKATTIITRRSGCACLTLLAAVVVLFGPAAWFPLPLAIVAYILLGVVAPAAGAGWFMQKTGRTAPKPRTPQPPPVPAPPESG
jgi:hypothetical protein